jgi:hypothetical protein
VQYVIICIQKQNLPKYHIGRNDGASTPALQVRSTSAPPILNELSSSALKTTGIVTYQDEYRYIKLPWEGLA